MDRSIIGYEVMAYHHGWTELDTGPGASLKVCSLMTWVRVHDGLLGNQQAFLRYHRFDTRIAATCLTEVSARHSSAAFIAVKIVPPSFIHAGD